MQGYIALQGWKERNNEILLKTVPKMSIVIPDRHNTLALAQITTFARFTEMLAQDDLSSFTNMRKLLDYFLISYYFAMT